MTLDGPVRVIHLLNTLDVGGMEAGVVKIVNGIDRSVVHGEICTFRRSDGAGDRLSSGTPLFQLNRRDGNDPRIVASLYTLFRRRSPHVVHTHSWGTLCEGTLAARLAGVPRVVHGEHGTMETRGRNLAVQRFVWNRVDRVLSVSERLADKMADIARFERRRIQVIRNGVDLTRFLPRDGGPIREAFAVAPCELLVLAVGRLVPVKDHSTLLKAFARLQSSGVPCRLLIAGDGPLRAALEQESRALGLEKTVTILGTRHDVPHLLAASDLFVLSSRSEGMSNTLLEAMAAGRPVVATRVGGNPEVVDESATGVLVEPDDAEVLAQAIEALAADRRRLRSMGVAGRDRVEREFSLDGMLSAYRTMYVDVATGRPRG